MSHMSTEPTRRALHAVAELVLAGPQHRTSGHIRLTVTPTGFRTFAEPDLRVDGVELVAAGQRVPIDGRTCADLAAPRASWSVCPTGSTTTAATPSPEQVLKLDPDAARWIERCWAAGAEALARLDPAQEAILWPEHFDVGIDSGRHRIRRVARRPVPRRALRLRQPRPGTRSGEFWNAPFGAARPMRDLNNGNADAVLAFFVEGRQRAGA